MSEPVNPNRNGTEGNLGNFSPSHIDLGKNSIPAVESVVDMTQDSNQGHNDDGQLLIQTSEPARGWDKYNRLSTYLGFAAAASYALGYFTFVTFFTVPVFAIIAIILAEQDKRQGHNYLLGKVLGWVFLGLAICAVFGMVFTIMALYSI